LVAKDTCKKRLRSKIWSPYEFGSNDVSRKLRNLKNLRNPFQNTFGNIKPPYSAESNSVAPFPTVMANFNQLFRQTIGCFSKKLVKGFETYMFLLFGLNPNPTLPKNTFLRSKNSFKIGLAFGKLVHSF